MAYLFIAIAVMCYIILVVMLLNRQRKSPIKHFSKEHFKGVTIRNRKFLYCPVGNICSWSSGDYDHSYCPWCKEYFEEIKK